MTHHPFLRIGLTAIASLALAACTPAQIADPTSTPPPPTSTPTTSPTTPPLVPNTVLPADSTKLDEQVAIATETAYTAASTALALAFRIGFIPTSTNPALRSSSFCAIVLANPSAPQPDQASRLTALDCRAHHYVVLTRKAYDTANAASYLSLSTQALGLVRELTAAFKP